MTRSAKSIGRNPIGCWKVKDQLPHDIHVRQSKRVAHFGDASRFADVLNTSPIFNAIMVVSTRGIMPGMDDGTFKPLSVVSGAESLNIIRNLKAKF